MDRMVTEFGKYCRKLRIDKGILLKDMAEKLEVTSAYLSAVENGKRNIPQAWFDKISSVYSLNGEQKKELSIVIEESNMRISDLFSKVDREKQEIILTFARKCNSLDKETINRINKMLSKD